MPAIEIYFEGYCPESFLKDEHIEMRLNTDDFWESEATGLQIAVFPPYASILPWRGRGQFRPTSAAASSLFTGLVLTQSQTVKGREHLPDESYLICNKEDLQEYVDEIYESHEAFEKSRFDYNEPVFERQVLYLSTLPSGVFLSLVGVYEEFKADYNIRGELHGDAFNTLHKMFYDLKLIFDFKWMDWKEGWNNINNSDFDFCTCSMLELSMYLTAIFRSDRFNDGAIDCSYRNGTLDRIFDAIKMKTMVKI